MTTQEASTQKTLTFVLMDAPYENARTTTALRLIDIAAGRGHNINVFTYEGAVYLPFALQKAHPNPVHGKDAEEEDHVLPREWVAATMAKAEANGGTVDWVNCGFCVDERGADEAIPGVRRGGPPNLVQWVGESDNVLVIPTK